MGPDEAYMFISYDSLKQDSGACLIASLRLLAKKALHSCSPCIVREFILRERLKASRERGSSSYRGKETIKPDLGTSGRDSLHR